MSIGRRLLKEHRYAELWHRYCGFLDLSPQEFMGVQRSLLMEQVALLQRCELGRRLLGPRSLTSVEEFRHSVPLTTYADYAPYLLEQREDVLPARPALWQRTSGASGEYRFKWAPITPRMYEEMGATVFAILILATARFKGDISFGEGESMLYALAPPPYATGCWGRRASEELPIRFLPSLQEAEEMTFEERLANGLRTGLDTGVDLVFGLPSVLVAIGEQIGERRVHSAELLRLARRPRALARALGGQVRSRLLRRPMQPRDLWRLRGLATAGTDASLYRDRLRELWGRTPLDVYGSTEGLVLATQAWDYGTMTFVPNFNFLEFLPVEERAGLSNGHPPRTLLLDEVQPGRSYELVITNFHGGPFVRYRLGDMVTIVSLSNDRLGIQLPQMTFYSRCDGLIDLAGFARLTEKTIGQAINRTGIPHEEWTARKEVHGSPALRIYIELRGNGVSAEQVAGAIHGELKRLDEPYAELEALLRRTPLEVVLLPSGAFRRYMGMQRERGADLAHVKPPHLNPSDDTVLALLGHGPRAVAEAPPVAVAG